MVRVGRGRVHTPKLSLLFVWASLDQFPISSGAKCLN